MRNKLDELDFKILLAMKEEGPLTTAQIAEEVGAPRDFVYRRCRRIARLLPSGNPTSLVSSELVESNRNLYFFPATGQVLTNTTYGQIDSVVSDLKGIARKRVKPRTQIPEDTKGRLLAEYAHYFDRLAAGKSDGQRRQIESFHSQLKAVMAGTTLGDVVGLFGVRPFRQKERKWKADAGQIKKKGFDFWKWLAGEDVNDELIHDLLRELPGKPSQPA